MSLIQVFELMRGKPSGPMRRHPPSLITISHRDAEWLANRHGYDDLAALAEDIPDGGSIADIGAGQSNLALSIALTRPDVTCYHVDPYLNRVSAPHRFYAKDKPDNLIYYPGDIDDTVRQFGPEAFDRVYSYWVLPWLSSLDVRPGAEAALGMYTVAKTGGLILAGPKRPTAYLPVPLSDRPSLRIEKKPGQVPQEVAHRVAIGTRMSRLSLLEMALRFRGYDLQEFMKRDKVRFPMAISQGGSDQTEGDAEVAHALEVVINEFGVDGLKRLLDDVSSPE